MKTTVRIILKGEKPKSWNTYWAGVHWSARKRERDRVHMLVRAEIDPETAAIFDVPVHIWINAYFKDKRSQLDSPNVVNKPYIDALEGWYIKNDKPENVAYVTTGSFIDKRRPRVEIEIRPIEIPF